MCCVGVIDAVTDTLSDVASSLSSVPGMSLRSHAVLDDVLEEAVESVARPAISLRRFMVESHKRRRVAIMQRHPELTYYLNAAIEQDSGTMA